MTTGTRELGPEGASSPEQRLERPQRFLALDTLRGIAILMVLFGHFLPDRIVFGQLAHHVTSLGRGGVLLFFLLSGYLIFRNVERQDTTIFLSRRLFKIFPAYSINVALIFLVGLFTAGHENWNLKLLLANLFMVQDIFGQDLLNGVFWTLLIEIKFYAFIALQYLLLRERGMLVIPLVFIMINTAIWFTRGHASVLLTFFPAFYVGIQIYRAERGNWNSTGTITACGMVALVALSLFMFDGYNGEWSAVYLVVEAALLALLLRRDISSRILNFFGRISYSDYLYHVSLGYLVFSLWGPLATWTGNLVSVLLAIALTTLVAYVSFRLIEVPMVAFGKLHEPLLRSSVQRVRAKLGLLNQA
jgi:peptidoglycan/LPS O-acetylase OafA/YrhL